MKRGWALFREAIRGSDRDYTTGPVGSALILLSVPMVLEMAMESLVGWFNAEWLLRG